MYSFTASTFDWDLSSPSVELPSSPTEALQPVLLVYIIMLEPSDLCEASSHTKSNEYIVVGAVYVLCVSNLPLVVLTDSSGLKGARV